MESSDAARFLHPRVLVLATAGASPGMGTLVPIKTEQGAEKASAIPLFFQLIASQCDLLTASNDNYEEICRKLQVIQIEVDTSFLGIQLPQQATVAQCVHAVLSLSTSPPGLCLLHDLIDAQLEQEHTSAYEPDSLIALFLRKTLIALHSLSFEAHARVTRNLVNFMLGKDVDKIYLPSPHAMVSHARQLARQSEVPGNADVDLDYHQQQQQQQQQQLQNQTTFSPMFPSPYVPTHQNASISLTTSHYIQHLHALKRRDLTQINDSLHRYFDRALYLFSNSPSSASSRSYFTSTTSTSSQKSTDPNIISEPHHFAALALAAAHAHTRPSASSCCASALDDAVRVGSGVRALIWLAYAEHRLPRRHVLLHSHPNVLARDQFHTVFTPVSDSSPYTFKQNEAAYNGLKPNIKRFSSLAPVIGRRISSSERRSPNSYHDILSDDSDKIDRLDDLLLLAALKLEQGDLGTALVNGKIAKRFCQDSPSLLKRASNALSLISIRREQMTKQESPTGLCPSNNLTDSFDTCAHWHWCKLIQSVRSGYGRKSLKHARVLSSLSSSSQSNSDIVLDALEAQVLSQQSNDESFHFCHTRLLQSAAEHHRCARYVRAQLLIVKSLLGSRTLCLALRVCLGAVSIADALGLSALHMEACVYLADCLGRQPDIAISILQPLLHRLHGCDPSVYAHALRVWAEAHCHQSKHLDYELIQQSLKQAISIYSSLDDLQALAKCTYLMARVWNARLELIGSVGQSSDNNRAGEAQHARQMRNLWSKRFRQAIKIINKRRI